MEDALRTVPRPLEHHFSELMKHWKKSYPQGLRELFKQNKRLDNFLLKTKEERKRYLENEVIYLEKTHTYLIKKELKKG